MIRWLERHFRKLAIPNLTLILVVAQGFFYLVGVTQPAIIDAMMLVPQKVLAGEVWRLASFMFLPPVFPHPGDPLNAVWLFFGLYMFYLMGSALEHEWGEFRYNLYLLVAYLATIASVWIDLNGVATNGFIFGSVFLAFAFLFPDFVIYIFFILPVKVKWLALITWLGYLYAIIVGDWLIKMLVLASVANFLLFFWRDVLRLAARGRRHMKRQLTPTAEGVQPFHKCAVCGRTDKSDPLLEFRYCNKCTGALCYCMDHIHKHEHR